MILGSHLSVSGGLNQAVLKAGQYGFDTVALFVRNQRQWNAAPLSAQAKEDFALARKQIPVAPVAAHGSYLINLAGQNDVRQKSIAALADELNRCSCLGIELYVFHPGSCADTEEGIVKIADALNAVVDKAPLPRVLLETTAGQGCGIASRFEHLADILNRLHHPRRFGVCMDTCHVFAAGYDIRTPAAYRQTMRQFDDLIGLDRLGAIHVNDSRGDLGCRVDRHEHIGQGKISIKGFANFVNDPRLSLVPMILETPKGFDSAGRDWDVINARTLRRLAT